MQAVLLCSEEATLTNLICLNGQQQADWSSHYRLYSHDRVEESALFDVALQHVLSVLPAGQPLVMALDDTLVRKTGTHIDGVGWKRDPLGPPFQTNLVRAQRYLQFSAAWPLKDGAARMVPVLFAHAPNASKPGRKADAQQWLQYKEARRQTRLNTYAIKHMKEFRDRCPEARKLIFCGDGSYTNADIIRALPAGSAYIGRIRKDARFHELPSGQDSNPKMGRPRRYGNLLPTPEQLRQNPEVSWQQVSAFASGKVHSFRIKTIPQALWRKSGTQHPLRVIVIAPVGYRLRKGSKLLYRQPAYLICTDPDLPIEDVLQYYLWRWGIEVNFREEKTLLGVGDAHVRTPASNRHLPAVIVAAYALMWTAALRMNHRGDVPHIVRPPCWRKTTGQTGELPSTGDLLRTLRSEIWATSVCSATFDHFVNAPISHTKPNKLPGDTMEEVRLAG